MTMIEFAERLKALLREAEDAGLPVDDFCKVAEHILETSWASKETV